MFELRKYIVVLVIAVLFAIFVQSSIEAIYPQPQYDDFCKSERSAKPYPLVRQTTECPEYLAPSQEKLDGCFDKKGQPDYNYDANGCPTKYECSYCNKFYNDSQKYYNFIVFIVSSIAGLIAIALGLILPSPKNVLNEWVGSGFMLGGVFTLFFGTATYYSDMHRIARPIVMLVELVIIIYLIYKVFGKNLKKK
jgi:hypothetical protein